MEDPTPEERRNFEKILGYINVTYRVMNCAEKIELLSEFSRYCKEHYLFRVAVFKWASKTLIFHRGVGHVIEAIKENDGYGLGITH